MENSKKAQSSKDPSLIYELDSWELKLGETCEKGSQLRPHVVWFGEDVPNIIQAVKIVKQADILIIVGTSLNVYPAAGLSYETRTGTPIFLVDPANVNISNLKNVKHIKSGAGEGLDRLVEQLMND
jgi:NAD-dependent deacetylase